MLRGINAEETNKQTSKSHLTFAFLLMPHSPDSSTHKPTPLSIPSGNVAHQDAADKVLDLTNRVCTTFPCAIVQGGFSDIYIGELDVKVNGNHAKQKVCSWRPFHAVYSVILFLFFNLKKSHRSQ